MERLWDFDAVTLGGEKVSLKTYEGKVALVVNVASECGFTPQYAGLQKLYEDYGPRGLVVLGFPSNQFGGQEPGSAEEIAAFCKKNYGVTFPLFQKADVKGEGKQPVYRFLTQTLPEPNWNFCKYLVDRSGRPVSFHESRVTPDDLRPEIERLLAESAE
ncbi:MAG: glutathione peroxidase [Deltaproteobacteria bacterium]|nr:MAG: glutathione peroxidase [Deltaproteobacteria bacterium]